VSRATLPKPSRSTPAANKSSTTVVEIPSRKTSPARSSTTVVEIQPRRTPTPRAKTITPISRSKAITIPRPKKPRASSRVPLYLLSEADARLAGHPLHVGLLVNPKPDEIYAYEPDDLAYHKLSTKNARYLEVDRIWPVMINEASALVRDNVCGGWRFQVVELGAPLMLDSPATWQRLLDDGLARKPKLKRAPSLLHWPAIKGYTDILRLLLDGGVQTHASDDLVCSAAAFGKRDTTKLLIVRGFDGKQAVAVMKKSKNETALAILRELGFG